MNTQLVTAAFMTTGLHTPDRPATAQSVFAHWDSGCVELIAELVAHVPYAEALIEAAFKLKGDMPGSFEYEIAEPFGQWYASAILKTSGPGQTPDVETCRHILRIMFLRMYSCDVGDDLDAALKLVRVDGDDVQPCTHNQ